MTLGMKSDLQGQVAQERQVDPEQEQPEVVEVLEGVQLEQGVLADVSGADAAGAEPTVRTSRARSS